MEILVAVAIFGFLATMAVSSFLAMSEKYKVEAETKQLYADLMDVRGRAMQRNRFHFVRFTTPYTYETYDDSNPFPDGDGALNAGDNQVTSVTVKHTITAADVDFNRNGVPNVTDNFVLSSTANADYDCITIRDTRIKMGKRIGTGRVCIEK